MSAVLTHREITLQRPDCLAGAPGFEPGNGGIKIRENARFCVLSSPICCSRVALAGQIDWDFLHMRFSSVCTPGPGQQPLPSGLVAGLFILKHMHNLSDEVLCAQWIENPYYQFFCGEETFQHAAPFDRSSLTRWRQRLGEEQLVALIQESLSAAHKIGA
jgi:Transposase domain (DUF772)